MPRIAYVQGEKIMKKIMYVLGCSILVVAMVLVVVVALNRSNNEDTNLISNEVQENSNEGSKKSSEVKRGSSVEPSQSSEVPVKSSEQPEKSSEVSVEPSEEPALFVYDQIKDSVFLKGEFEVYDDGTLDEIEDKLNIYNNTMINFDDEFCNEIIDNLRKKGWSKHTIDNNGDGGYYIKGPSGSIIKDAKRYKQLTNDFLEDSGIQAYLDKSNIDYEVVVEEDGLQAFCYLLCEGQRTGSYIRMNFEGEKSCTECVMYLYKTELIEKIDRIPFEKICENAFDIYQDPSDELMEEHSYLCHHFSIRYIDGLPYYYFAASVVGKSWQFDGFALAVDVSKSKNIELIQEKYNNFSR